MCEVLEMVEDKIGRRELLLYALYGVDTEIIQSAKLLDSDRSAYRNEALEIVKLSDIRKLIGDELRMIDGTENQNAID
jgi:hypothetical protein